MTEQQPIHYAVLVKEPGKVGRVNPDETVTYAWRCIYANGDLAAARRVAEEYARDNHGEPAVVMSYVDHVSAGVAVTWGKPNG